MALQFAVDMSPVKRERLKKLAALKRKLDMRAALPVLSKEEIRRYRLKYHEALIKDLQEQNYPSSAEYLKQLVDYQEALRQEHGPDTKVWARPQLIKTKEELDVLFEGLKTAEQAHYDRLYAVECDELIKLAVRYAFGLEDWWWLGEQLLIQCSAVSSNYHGDGDRRKALSKFIFGKFILENLRDPQRASVYLKQSREISMGKSWTAKKELGGAQHTVFTESCTFLYRALLEEAKGLINVGPSKGQRICTIARRRANDACDKKGEADVLMVQGLCEINTGNYQAASVTSWKALQLYLKIDYLEGICDARIQLALAYLKNKQSTKALEQLELLHQFAEEKNLLYYIGQAHRFFGEFYLTEGRPNLATPYLIKSLNIFHEMDKIADREQARCMAAVSAGQELMPRYVELILKCGKLEKIAEKYLFKLVQWKDTRELFWTEDSVTSLPGSSQVFSIVASIKNVVPKISALSVSDEIVVTENQVPDTETAD